MIHKRGHQCAVSVPVIVRSYSQYDAASTLWPHEILSPFDGFLRVRVHAVPHLFEAHVHHLAPKMREDLPEADRPRVKHPEHDRAERRRQSHRGAVLGSAPRSKHREKCRHGARGVEQVQVEGSRPPQVVGRPVVVSRGDAGCERVHQVLDGQGLAKILEVLAQVQVEPPEQDTRAASVGVFEFVFPFHRDALLAVTQSRAGARG